MNWPRILVVAAFAVTPCGASSEQMEIRAGEHGDFTRVVLAFERLPSWSAGRTEAGYSISLIGDGPLETDTSRLFSLIGRDRIRDITVDREARRLEIELACECHAEIFELNNIRLVVDVRDGAIGPRATHETNDASSSTSPRPRPGAEALSVADDINPQTTVVGLAEPPSIPRRSIFGGLPDETVERPTPPHSLPDQDSVTGSAMRLDSEDAEEIPDFALGNDALPSLFPTFDPLPTINSTAIDALSQQLSRAASQGLVEVDTSTTAQEQDVVPTPGPQNFRILTGLDRDTRLLSEQSSATQRGTGCMADRFVDIGSWGNTADLTALGELRSEIVRETGTVDEGKMLQLSRYYVALGFGAEAKFAASFLPESRDREVLFALSEIVDTGRSNSPLFEGQIACPGQIALWAAVARPFSRAELPVETDGILRTFSALPPHLREHLGPVLSQRLRSAGEAALARAALAAVTRVGARSPGQALTSARLKLSGTRAEEARAELEQLAQGTNIEAVEALIELLHDADRRGVAPKPSWVDDADTLMRVTAGTRSAEELSVAALRGHIPLGRFDDLRRALVEDRPGITDNVRRDIAVEALSFAVEDADDETFLRSELGFSAYAAPDALDSSVRYAKASRFLELGLPELAAKYLPSTMESDEEAGLTAATLVALGRRADALSVTEGRTSNELRKMRAEILARVGEFEESADLFAELGEQRAAEAQALRSGDWGWIVERGPGSLAETTLAATAPAPERLVTIGDNSELIEDVTRRREAYADLLGRTTPITTQ